MRTSQGVEVADIFRQYGQDYRRAHRMPINHLRAMHAIEVCRTATLGGHRYKYSCGHVDISYNSCRNRHCPKCQTLQKEKWIEARCEDLLPIQYFHRGIYHTLGVKSPGDHEPEGHVQHTVPFSLRDAYGALQ